MFPASSFFPQSISLFLQQRVFFFICCYLAADNYALLFLRKGTSDYVNTSGMPSLKAVTVCLWMKTADKGNEGTLLSYAVPGNANELLLVDYRNFALFVRGHWSRYKCIQAQKL